MRDVERILVAIWCADETDSRCLTPITLGSEPAETRLVPERLLSQDCFAGTPDQSAACLDRPGTALGGFGEVQLRVLEWRADVPRTRSDDAVLFLRAHAATISDDVDASLARIRLTNLVLAATLPAIAFLLGTSRVRRGMMLSAVGLVPLGLTLLGSVDTTAWTLTGTLVTWAATMTVLEPVALWRRVSAGVLSVVGAILLATPISSDPMRTGVAVGLSVVISVVVRSLDDPQRWWRRDRVFTATAGLLAAVALWRAFRPLPWETGLFEPGRTSSELIEAFRALPALLGGVVGSGVAPDVLLLSLPGPISAGLTLLGAGIVIFAIVARDAPSRALIAVLLVFVALQAVHLPLANRVPVDAGLYTGRHLLPFVLLLLAVCGALPLSRSARGLSRPAMNVAGVVAVSLHAAALNVWIQRFVADRSGRGLWPSAEDWWWDLGFGPGIVWVAGSLAFAVLTLLAVRATGASQDREADRA